MLFSSSLLLLSWVLHRDPRWGRGMETPGEDPYLNGQYAIMFAKGMQEGEDSRYIKAIATLKHYAAYSLEDWKGFNRHSFNAIVSDQDLVQTYLPAFEAGIRQGKAKSVMCRYVYKRSNFLFDCFFVCFGTRCAHGFFSRSMFVLQLQRCKW